MIAGLIIGLVIGASLGVLIMACMVMAKRADSGGISLETRGSHATNPFQVRDGANGD